MKNIVITNWSLLILYSVLLTYAALTLNHSGTDAAGRGLATAYLVFGFILLVFLIGVNFLPFRFTRIGVFVLLLVPIASGLVQAMRQLVMNQQTKRNEVTQFNGSYYFRDPQRQELAATIAAHDITKLRTLLQQPVPQLNESGTDHITLLDFAALQSITSDSQEWVIPCLSLLLAKGATFQTADTLRSPTHALVSRDCSKDLMEWFLTNGADANAKRIQEYPTPILFTVMDYDKDRLEKVRLLLAHGADANSVYPPAAAGWLAGHSALLAAARLDVWDVCQLLLEKGADATTEGPQHLRFTDLITRRAEINAKNGETPAAFSALIQHMNLSTDK